MSVVWEEAVVALMFYKTYSQRKVSVLGRYMGRRFVRYLVGLIARYTPRGESICEIGPGDGVLAEVLNGLYKYIGFDRSEIQVRDMQRRGIVARVCDVPPIPVAKGSVAAVVASNVFEHFDGYRNAEKFLRDCNDVLTNSGKLYIVVPDVYDDMPDFFDACYSHSYPTTAGRVINILEDNGFKILYAQARYGGSLPFLPGAFLNLAVKLCFRLGNPVIGHFCLRRSGMRKLSAMFSRLIVIVAQRGSE
jgi:SAM-dependent methyltransferase